MPETRRKYDPESREGAVRIVRETDTPLVEVARARGSTPEPWGTGSTRTAAIGERRPTPPRSIPTTCASSRRENAELRVESDGPFDVSARVPPSVQR